jgi:TPR repeat protein
MAARGCQALKNQTACAGMAAGLASAGDSGQASALLDTACAAGDSDGCRFKANALFYDKKDDASRAQAIALFEAGCKAKRAWGCLGMADAYIHGWGVAKNLKTAGDYERTGCLQGQGEKVRLCTLSVFPSYNRYC